MEWDVLTKIKHIKKKQCYNREREENYLKDREDASSANIWERVVREFDVTNAKTGHHTRDVSRMKQLMLDLRKDSKAPGTIVEA